MPYIKQEARDKYHPLVEQLNSATPPNALENLIELILHSFYAEECYHNYMCMLGTLEAVEQELERRLDEPAFNTVDGCSHTELTHFEIELCMKLINTIAKESGHLNYIITKLLSRTYHNYGVIPFRFEVVKNSLYNNFVAKYEDQKIEENGDLDEFV